MPKLKTIKTRLPVPIASQVQEFLRDNGIESILQNDMVGVFGSQSPVGFADVCVQEEKVEEALKLIQECFGEL